MSNSARIQLTFNLDDSVEQEIYNVLREIPKRRKAKYVSKVLYDAIHQESNAAQLAELIAKYLSEKISVSQPINPEINQQVPKRKRGRPRKEKSGIVLEASTKSNAEIFQSQKENINKSLAPDTSPIEVLPDDEMLASMMAAVGEV